MGIFAEGIFADEGIFAAEFEEDLMGPDGHLLH